MDEPDVFGATSLEFASGEMACNVFIASWSELQGVANEAVGRSVSLVALSGLSALDAMYYDVISVRVKVRVRVLVRLMHLM